MTKSVIGNLSIQTIPENALLDSVVKHLEGREAFKDADPNNNERIYHGDVFEAIASEIAQIKDTDNLTGYEKKNFDQLNELAELISADYVLVTQA